MHTAAHAQRSYPVCTPLGVFALHAACFRAHVLCNVYCVYLPCRRLGWKLRSSSRASTWRLSMHQDTGTVVKWSVLKQHDTVITQWQHFDFRLCKAIADSSRQNDQSLNLSDCINEIWMFGLLINMIVSHVGFFSMSEQFIYTPSVYEFIIRAFRWSWNQCMMLREDQMNASSLCEPLWQSWLTTSCVGRREY